MEKFFGRTYETVGDVSGDLLLKTRGGVKVQIGSSFIDLVKNGKINVDIDIIKEASSKDSIIDNGLYLIDNILYVKYQDTILPLGDNSNRDSVSYLPQLEITQDQQIQAQKNIGIYYDTLEEAQKNISNGYAYINSQGLYLFNNQSAQQVLTTDYFSLGILNLSTLNIGETSLQESKITLTNYLDIVLNQQYLLKISNQYCEIKNTLLVTTLQGYEGSFQLYTSTNGESYLKVDHIICSDSNQNYQANICYSKYYYNNLNNVIIEIKVDSTTKAITLYFKYSVTYQGGDILHVEFDKSVYDFTITSYNPNENTAEVTLEDKSLDPTNISQQTICYCKPINTTLIGYSIENNTITYGNNINKTILGKLPDGLKISNGFYSDSIVTKNQILISPNLDTPNLTNTIFKKSDNFPKLEEGWELPKEDNSQNLATTKWVNSNKYILPIATSSILGGVMIGNGLSITDTGVLSVVDNWTSTLNNISNNTNTNTNDITTLKSQVANLQKAVRDLQDKLESLTE